MPTKTQNTVSEIPQGRELYEEEGAAKGMIAGNTVFRQCIAMSIVGLSEALEEALRASTLLFDTGSSHFCTEARAGLTTFASSCMLVKRRVYSIFGPCSGGFSACTKR